MSLWRSSGKGKAVPPASAAAAAASASAAAPPVAREPQPQYVPSPQLPTALPQQKLYDTGGLYATAADADAFEVQSLSQLTATTEPLGAGSGSPAPCAVIKGVRGYASFLNGAYRRVEDLLHESRYVYKQDTTVPMGNSPAAGKQLILYYKAKQKAWAIGLKLGSAGVLAFRHTHDMEPFGGDAVWHVSDPNGRFLPDSNVIVSPAGGFTVPAKSMVMGSERQQLHGVLAPDTSRSRAEGKLLKHMANTGRAGAFAIRQSTSTPNAFILSVIDEQQQVVHVRLDYANNLFYLPGSPHSAASLDELIVVIRQQGQPIRLASGQFLPRLTEQVME